MLTLIEAAKKNSGEVHRSTIIELFARSTQLLGILPFMDVKGNAYSYNREEALPGIGFRGVNEGYTESTGVLNQQTESLVICGGDLDVDKFILDTMGMGQRGAQENLKIKALAQAISHNFIKGDVSSNPKQFDGLQARLVTSGSQVIVAKSGSATSGGDPLQISQLDAAIDQVVEPTHILMNKAMRRRLTTAAKNSSIGGDLQWNKDDFGRQVAFYNSLPIIEMDPLDSAYRTLAFDEAGPGGGTTSTSIYVVSIGEGKLHGLQNGDMDVRDLGELESKPSFRTRVEWYLGLGLFHPKAAARVWGISNAAVTA